jgi:hypothetical protein
MKDQVSDTLQFDNLERVRGRTTFDGTAAFRVLEAAFMKALEKNPESSYESFYTFAGQSVCFRIIGRDLAKHITSPFSHLQTNGPVPLSPQLTVDLWDENATGIRCRVSPTDSDFRWTEVTATSPDNRFVGQRLPHTFSCFDRLTNRIIGSIAWHEQIFIYERAKPLARLLVEWHLDRKVQVIHAGLVARNGQGILFAAKSGSGKSTSALACLCGGFDYLSEDYVGLQGLADGSFLGHSLYNSVFLETSHLTRFPNLFPHVIRGKPSEEKSVVILSQVFPQRLERVVPIRAILIPRIAGTRESKVSPASKGQALLAVGPSSLLQIPSRRMTRGFNTLAQLVEQVPCYWLESGHDLDLIPRCVEEFIAKEASAWNRL